jgi:hypothetical protein
MRSASLGRTGRGQRNSSKPAPTPPGAAHGADIDGQGNGTAAGQRTYQLVRQQAAIADLEFEIQLVEPGLEAFCFTFG